MSIRAPKITGGRALVEAARANGARTVFALPGAQIYPLFDALHATGTQLIVPRHEQAAAYMAMGYAKSTGRTGVFAVVPGPGVLNTAAALCTAMGNCAPLVCLTGQVPSQFLGKGRGHLHELADQRATLRTLIKDAVRVDDATDTMAVVTRAFRTARSGRPGPVAVEMCWDVMAAEAEIAIGAADGTTNDDEDEPAPDLDSIDAAAAVLRGARRPMIMCGAGAQHAAAEVRELAELLGAPVTAFRSGRGIVPEDHPLGVAAVAARELWDGVDVLLGIGSRLEMPYVRWRDPMRYEREPVGGPTLIRIDVDPAEMERFRPHVGVVADAATACRLLVDRLAGGGAVARGWSDEVARAKLVARGLLQRLQPQTAYLEAIRAVVPRDGFLVPELSQAGFATYTGAYPVLEPRTYVSEGYQGTLGFGFPTALGVKVANPDKAVVSITGDGGFAFGLQELATAAQYRIAVVTILFNNRSYGNVLRDQELSFGGRTIGCRLDNPDFVKLAESFGVDAVRVRDPSALRGALDRALAVGRPALLEVEIEPGTEASPWPFIHMRSRPTAMDGGSAAIAGSKLRP
ncbi:MAG TPA: thiamine pyrophosphate-dependent enzyme [Gammaproteobacteria bacterium]|nr:thiamine pyrophosphate-dependent enzyme [Gammaproteobacteria bacterium]